MSDELFKEPDQSQVAAALATKEEPAPTPADIKPPAATEDGEMKHNDRKILIELAEERKKRQALESKLKEIEDVDLTTQERLTKQLQEAQETAARATSEALRLRVAAELNVPAELHEFLTGDSEDEIRAKAQKLAAMASTASKRPQPDPSQGAKPGSTGPSQFTKADLDRMTPDQVANALRDGLLSDVLAGKA